MAKGNRTLPDPTVYMQPQQAALYSQSARRQTPEGIEQMQPQQAALESGLAMPVAEVIQAGAAAVVPPSVPLPETGGASARMYALAAAKVCESPALMPQSRAKAIAYLKAAIAMLEG